MKFYTEIFHNVLKRYMIFLWYECYQMSLIINVETSANRKTNKLNGVCSFQQLYFTNKSYIYFCRPKLFLYWIAPFEITNTFEWNIYKHFALLRWHLILEYFQAYSQLALNIYLTRFECPYLVICTKLNWSWTQYPMKCDIPI